MPGRIDAGLVNLFSRPDKKIESHTTFEALVKTTSVARNYYFASAELTISGIVYLPQLRKGSQISSTLTRAADQATVELQNVDTETGLEFLSLGQSAYGAAVKIGRWWMDLDSGAEFHAILFTGVLDGFSPDERVTRLASVGIAYAQVSVGASRRVVPQCQWTFRDATTCGFAGSQLTCNFLLDSQDGCEGRHGGGVGATLKRAKFGGFVHLNSQNRFSTL